MTDLNILMAGFGGQGILFGGKVMAYAEMRGGTANCSVCISDSPIGSPLVTAPDVLMVMNLPSLDKFEDAVVPGGTIVVDSSIVTRKVVRKDVNAVYVDASAIAEKEGLKGMANMVLVGKIHSLTGFCSPENLDKGLAKSVPARKAAALDLNRRAIEIGRSL
jgi:2-oxoglutarate ferredoxin oxidoreductase subunit gamma